MKNAAKLIVVGIFAITGLGLLLGSVDLSSRRLGRFGTGRTDSDARGKQTREHRTVPAAPAAGDKKIPKSFVLGKDSLSEYGEVPFDHDTHAFKTYSPDGKSVVGCVECHHTDQPKSALKPPLVTSERDVVLTMDVFQKVDAKGLDMPSCHFQEGNVPDGKEMPTAGGKNLNNELAYHINCNTCHDAAFKVRPELKGKKGFATSKDCLVCHTKN